MTYHKHNIVNSGFINTSESYSDGFIIGYKNLVIPYINIGLIPDNPINGRQCVIDYCYYVFFEVKSLEINYPTQKIQVNFNLGNIAVGLIEEYIILGGINTQNGSEAKIICNGMSLYIKPSSKFSEPSRPFVPFDTPIYRQNLDRDEVNSFLSFNNLPEEINTIVGKQPYTLT